MVFEIFSFTYNVDDSNEGAAPNVLSWREIRVSVGPVRCCIRVISDGINVYLKLNLYTNGGRPQAE